MDSVAEFVRLAADGADTSQESLQSTVAASVFLADMLTAAGAADAGAAPQLAATARASILSTLALAIVSAAERSAPPPAGNATAAAPPLPPDVVAAASSSLASLASGASTASVSGVTKAASALPPSARRWARRRQPAPRAACRPTWPPTSARR
jgi:hypothetical protein